MTVTEDAAEVIAETMATHLDATTLTGRTIVDQIAYKAAAALSRKSLLNEVAP